MKLDPLLRRSTNDFAGVQVGRGTPFPGRWVDWDPRHTPECISAPYILAHQALRGVTKHEHDRVTAKEHLADVTVLVDRFCLLLPLPCLGLLCPHFLHVRQHPAGRQVRHADPWGRHEKKS